MKIGRPFADDARSCSRSIGSRRLLWLPERASEVSGHIWRSFVRQGYPVTVRERTAIMVNNFFLHVHPPRVHPHSLRPTYTLGLGLITALLYAILAVTGLLLMLYYVPATAEAYGKMQDLIFVVAFGRLVRNLHRWAAEAMVVAAFLHMCRVFYTAAYKPPREFNWVVGVALLLLTLALSFTGYLLPWDQLSFWAITVGTGIVSYFPLLGDGIRFVLLGGDTVGGEALLRFYVLHVGILPAATTVLIAYHFWRIRKDGGLARPAQAGNNHAATVLSFPRVAAIELLLLLALLVFLVPVSHVFDAPLAQIANPEHPPNPAKAPWYFVGLQELVSYSAFWGGIIVPGLVLLGLLLLPYLDRRPHGIGEWAFRQRRWAWILWTAFVLVTAVLTLVGAQFRGPNWNFYWPWEGWPGPG